MKKQFYKTLLYTLSSLALLNLAACDDKEKNPLDLSGEVKILSFTVNGEEGIIDEEKGTITLELSKEIELTALKPVITLSEKAQVTPASEAVTDLSKLTTYRVTNGNLYHNYYVIASHINAQFLNFSIGRYRGIINNDERTVLVKVPVETDLTALNPSFTVTSGAVISPEEGTTHDFTQPVKYTLNYKGETFVYTVTVEPANIQPVAFIGTATSANEISDADEKAAYQWFENNFADYQYLSFNAVKNGEDLSDYAVIWWHYDGSNTGLPLTALEATVVNQLKAYYREGGSFFFSGWAVQYVSALGIAKDGKEVNNIWGEGNDAFTIDDDWGLYFGGNEDHPVFTGLQKPIGVNNVAYLQSKGVKAKGHNAIWNFEWGDYEHNRTGWEAASGAKNLAAFHWEDNLDNRSLLFEYPKEEGTGGAICIGAEVYDWYNEDGSPENSYRGNLETLTLNIINYLSE